MKSDYQRMKIYREALKKIERALSGIDFADLTQAEQRILNIIRVAKTESAR